MRHLALCLFVLALGTPAAADSPASAPARSGPPAPAGYAFAPGDVIDITVSSHQGYDRTLTIPPDGRIQFPAVGEITAAGLTAAQLAVRIQGGLNKELVDPQVTVSLKELNKGYMPRVSVLGSVKTPGVYELKGQSTLAEMLAAAGGPTPVADLRRITITRAGSDRKITADLSGAARGGDAGDPVPLQPGDLILVPEGASPTVTVLGEVVKPGSYPVEGEMRLLNALSMAGGPTAKADLHHVALTRAGQSSREILDLQSLLTGGQPENPAANVPLHPGDTLVLPEGEQKYYVIGEVNKADSYPLKPNDRLLDAITTAGGSTHDADLSQVTLIRKNDKGQALAQRIDLKRMMQQGNLARNEALVAGDVIFIPDRKPKRSIADYLGILNPFSTLLYVLR